MIQTIHEGKKYGMLTIIKRAGSLKGRSIWLCECECGKKVEANSNILNSGGRTSCGCKIKNFSHLLSGHRLYATRMGMIRRCKNDMGYADIGITVCDKRQGDEGLRIFIDDMYDSFEEGKSLDRIDNGKGYSKENCKRSTPKEQSKNRRNSRIIMGKTSREIAEEQGINIHAITTRVRRGWTDEEIIRGKKSLHMECKVKIFGYSIAEISEITGFSKSYTRNIHHRKQSEEKILPILKEKGKV